MVHNRIAKYYGDTGDGAGMRKGPPIVGVRTDAPAVDGDFVSAMISERWVGTDRELAEVADISVSGLADMKANGAKIKNTNFRKLCKQLGADVRAAAKGKRVYVADVSANRRQDLHDLLNRLIGTPNENVVERVMQGLVKVG